MVHLWRYSVNKIVTLAIKVTFYKRGEYNMIKVVQCWDDGVLNDIRLTELLRKYNAKATFNLNPAFHEDERLEASWKAAGSNEWSCKGFRDGKLSKNELVDVYSGFKIASHCMRHENAGSIPDDEFLKAALDARHYLEDLFQMDCTGFAWPCGVYTQSTADALLEAGFSYGRTVENTDCVEKLSHPMLLHPTCHFQDNDFYKHYDQVKKDNGIFYFWGHSYECLDSEGLWNQLEHKLKYITDDEEAEWCDLDSIDWKALAENNG